MNSVKSAKKSAIAHSRASHPQLYVRIPGHDWRGPRMAKASVRIKSGEYQYLTWRDGDQVRTFYLGKKRQS